MSSGGENYLATGLEVGRCTKYYRNGGSWEGGVGRGKGARSQAPIGEEASSIPVGQNGSETQSRMR